MLPLSHVRHLVAAVLVTACCLAASLATAPPAGAQATASEAQMATMINDLRISRGLPPLPVDVGMSDDARSWSGHMASTGMAHDPNSGRSCDRFPGRGACRENVGYSTSGFGRVQAGFEGSPHHLANLLCDCTHMGIGIVVSGGRTYVTQRFVHDGRSATPPMRQSMTPTLLDMATSYVRAGYADFFGRAPSASELDYWTTRVLSPYQRSRLVWSLGYSDEWIGAMVDDFYQVALGRPADAAGRRYWIDQIQHGVFAPADVAARFYASQEYFDRRGRDLSRWVGDLYSEVLGRPADVAGLAHWIAVAQHYGRTTVAVHFYNSSETLRVRVDELYQKLLGRSVDPGALDHWLRTLPQTRNDVGVALSLATSAEYRRLAVERF